MPNEISHCSDCTIMDTTSVIQHRPPSQLDKLESLPEDDYIRYNLSRNKNGFVMKNHSFAGLEGVYPDSYSDPIARSNSNKSKFSKVRSTDSYPMKELCDSCNVQESHRKPLLYRYHHNKSNASSVLHGVETNSNESAQLDRDRNRDQKEVPIENQKSANRHGISRKLGKSERIMHDLGNNNNAKTLETEGALELSSNRQNTEVQSDLHGTAAPQEVPSLQSPGSSSDDSNRSTTSNSGKPRTLTRQMIFRMDSVELIESLLGASLVLQNNIKPPRHRASNPFPTGTKKLGRKKRNSQPTTNKLEDYRLVFLGSGGVGKSSLVEQFLHGIFPSQYNPTVEESYRHLVQLPDGVFHTIEILDTAGLHQFPAMRRLSIISGDAFIVVFSLDKKDSFQEALEIVKLIFEIKGTKDKSKIPVILVGNKSDLEAKREVTEEEALSASLEHKLYAYIQTSAKDNENVQKLFSELMVHVFGVQERLQQAEAKQGSGLTKLSRQLSERVRKMSQSTRRHHSDSGDYRKTAVRQGDADDKIKKCKLATSCTNRGCVLGEPSCCIL